MKCAITDLHRKSSEVLRTIERNERVTLFHRGRATAVVVPISEQAPGPSMSAKHPPAVGMWAEREDMKNVAAYVRSLRGSRTRLC